MGSAGAENAKVNTEEKGGSRNTIGGSGKKGRVEGAIRTRNNRE